MSSSSTPEVGVVQAPAAGGYSRSSRICLSSIGTTAVGVGLDESLLAVEVPKPAFLYSDVELYEVYQG